MHVQKGGVRVKFIMRGWVCTGESFEMRGEGEGL